MPQLDVGPWFLTLAFSWFVFLTLTMIKILSHAFPNEATSQSAEKPKTQAWNWPWL